MNVIEFNRIPKQRGDFFRGVTSQAAADGGNEKGKFPVKHRPTQEGFYPTRNRANGQRFKAFVFRRQRVCFARKANTYTHFSPKCKGAFCRSRSMYAR